jgi:hypothetical protein
VLLIEPDGASLTKSIAPPLDVAAYRVSDRPAGGCGVLGGACTYGAGTYSNAPMSE